MRPHVIAMGSRKKANVAATAGWSKISNFFSKTTESAARPAKRYVVVSCRYLRC